MEVLVAGGTGFIGTHLCRELHDRGHDVTALSRDPTDVEPDVELPADVERVSGDVTAYGSIAETVADHEAVVNLVALSPLFEPTGDVGQEEVHLGGTRNLVRASEDGGVRRFVQVSGPGADPDAPTAHLRAKGRAEEVVREAALEWVIVRPSVVFGDGDEIRSFTRLVTTPYVTALPGGGRTRFQLLWVGDLVPMLADCVEDDGRAGETYELGGPEVLTLADVTELVYASEGRSVRILPVPMPVAKLGFVVADAIPFVPLGRDQARGLELDSTFSENDVTAFGRSADELTTLREFLAREAGRTSHQAT